MNRSTDIEDIVVAAHTLTRLAALSTRNETPSAQWRALSVLRGEGPLRLGALAIATRTTQPGMTRLVGQLADSGLVTRDADPSDSRASVIAITEAGAEALHAWRVELGDALEPFFAGLDDDDWHALSRTARILAARASQDAGALR